MDNRLIGPAISTLPIGRMTSAPLQAMIAVQTSAAKSYADFLLQVCIQSGKAVAVQFDHDKTIADEKGVVQGTIQKTTHIPLLCVVVHPAVAIEEDTIGFELGVTQSGKSSSTTKAKGSFQAKFDQGSFSISVSGRASHKSEQTRSTDTCVKYPFHTQVERQDPPKALIHVMEFSTDAATKPVVVRGKENDAKPLPAMPAGGMMIGEKVPAGGDAPAPVPVTP